MRPPAPRPQGPRPPGHPSAPPSRRAVLAAALSTGVLAGCARGTQTRAAPPGTVTLNNDNSGWTPGYDAASTVLDRRTGYRMAVRAVPNVSNYQQVVRMSAQTGTSTDLVKWWNGYRLQDIARNGLLTDLTAVWESALEQGWVNPALRESFTWSGRQYAVPLYQSYYPVFYSRKAFADRGLQVPTTFAQFRDLCRALAADGVVPVQAPGASSWEALIWFEQLVAGSDPGFWTALTAGEAGYEDEPAQRAMALWSELYADGVFSPADVDVSGAIGKFGDGTAGMVLTGSWFSNTLVTAGLTGEQIGTFLLPPVEPAAQPVVFVESSALAVPRNAHKRTAAEEVAGAWLAPDVQVAWTGFLQDSSANPQVPAPSPLVADLTAEVDRSAPRELIRYWEASPPALVEGNVLDLGGFMADPTPANARATLRSMARRARTEWDTWRNP